MSISRAGFHSTSFWSQGQESKYVGSRGNQRALLEMIHGVRMKMISRRRFLQAGAVTAAASAIPLAGAATTHEPARSPQQKRRNVLFIAVDDQNTSLGCYGNSTVYSPNLDALAARGTRFDRAYCQYPLCSPSRTSLMTGLAPDTTKIYDLVTHFRTVLPNVITVGELFRKNGYNTARVGKIYHTDVPGEIGADGLDDAGNWDYKFNPRGVDHPDEEPFVTNFTPQLTRHTKSGKPLLGGTISYYESNSPDSAMTDSLGADEMIRLLREYKEKPFFIAYGLYRPHVPWIVPKAYFDKFPIEQIQAPPFDPNSLEQVPKAACWTHPPNFGMNEEQRKEAIRAYYASSSFMDAQVGRVLKELKELGLEENTIVVFWADHGWSLGQHGQWEKQTLFEPSARVPLIFAGPDVKPGQICQRTVEHLDIYPTLAELCGLSMSPSQLHGKSLRGLLHNAESHWDKPAISQVTRPASQSPDTFGYSIRTERYRYTCWQGVEVGEELYDYQTDPNEMKNLAHDPQMKELCEKLRGELATITAQRGRSIELGLVTKAAGPRSVNQGTASENRD